MPAQFLSCDWGTSSFRLRLVSTTTLEILSQVETADGVKDIFNQHRPEWSRSDVFAEVMRKNLASIAAKSPLENSPVVISGMASSSIGWKELSYAKLPLSLKAEGLRADFLEWDSPDNVGPTYLVSGAATELDVMRGEECQAIGILAQASLEPYRNKALLILPGTHSKHILINDEHITDFHTFMTGELYDVFSKHTVLAPTVQPPEYDRIPPFLEGLKFVHTHGLAASLFKVRARHVLHGVNPVDNAAFLSGLLIGAETRELSNYHDRPVVVVANDKLGMLYSIALRPHRPNDLFINEIETATTAAHRLILSRLFNEL